MEYSDLFAADADPGMFCNEASPKWGISDVQNAMDAMRELERKFPPLPPEKIVLSYRGEMLMADPLEVAAWLEGRHMPSIVSEFKRWWLATCLRCRLPVEIYKMREPLIAFPRQDFAYRTAFPLILTHTA